MKILSIDPGSKYSAYCIFDCAKFVPLDTGILPNDEIKELVRSTYIVTLVIEKMVSYGMPVGDEVFDTCYWIGRFMEVFKGDIHLLTRPEIKLHLCNAMRAKDKNVRAALLDRFNPDGGGSTPSIGTKKQPGPLYGIKKDMWSTLAISVVFTEQRKINRDVDLFG